jgi:UMF1 family MFS transporter
MGKFGDIIGPVLMGYISLLFGSQRIGILSILLLFITGLILFLKVSDHNINSE